MKRYRKNSARTQHFQFALDDSSTAHETELACHVAEVELLQTLLQCVDTTTAASPPASQRLRRRLEKFAKPLLQQCLPSGSSNHQLDSSTQHSHAYNILRFVLQHEFCQEHRAKLAVHVAPRVPCGNALQLHSVLANTCSYGQFLHFVLTFNSDSGLGDSSSVQHCDFYQFLQLCTESNSNSTRALLAVEYLLQCVEDLNYHTKHTHPSVHPASLAVTQGVLG
uniref:Meiotic coiled-coil protein 1 n=1 Tax=Lygus hesperus TaxID=30085 RepID=A0A0A9W443_LYGHE